MLKYIGKYNECTILIDNIEENVVTQLYSMLNNPAFENSNISIMPDCHIGSGAVVGFTMTTNNFIVPSVIGVDIGCGIDAYNLGKISSKRDKLDIFIKNNIPSGSNIREKSLVEPDYIAPIIKKMKLDGAYMYKSLGSLGGGNHFIELDIDEHNNNWLVIHSGSRNFGLQVAKYHINKAKDYMKEVYGGGAYNGLEYLDINKDNGIEYINDMQIAQKYAELNRELIAKQIIEKFYKLQFKKVEKISSIHNYINLKDNIVRKGAISAHEGEKVIIPLNRAYGCVIGTGKSSKENNYSAPHGAGRIMNRGEAKYKITLEKYQYSMKNIYSTTVSKNTLDESPMVYKKPQFIIDSIKDIVNIDSIIKPVYSFKADS